MSGFNCVIPHGGYFASMPVQFLSRVLVKFAEYKHTPKYASAILCYFYCRTQRENGYTKELQGVEFSYMDLCRELNIPISLRPTVKRNVEWLKKEEWIALEIGGNTRRKNFATVNLTKVLQYANHNGAAKLNNYDTQAEEMMRLIEERGLAK